MQTIHLINPFWDCFGGSERHALEFYRELLQAGHRRVELWTEYEPDQHLVSEYPIRRIHPYRGEVPRDGTMIFFGAYFPVGEWYRHAKPEKVILIYNTVAPEQFFERMHALSTGRANVNVAYTSGWLKDSLGLPGPVIHSPINLEHFRPITENDDRRPYTIGRVSRDVLSKHHPRDTELYRRLIQQGCRIQIAGGTCLRTRNADPEGIDLRPSVPYQGLPDFMHELDVFFYRTGILWKEAIGRVVMEAMACGLPVVCDHFGGYAELVDDRVNGRLFETEDEALQILIELQHDKDMRAAYGKAARQTVERLMQERSDQITTLLNQ